MRLQSPQTLCSRHACELDKARAPSKCIRSAPLASTSLPEQPAPLPCRCICRPLLKFSTHQATPSSSPSWCAGSYPSTSGSTAPFSQPPARRRPRSRPAPSPPRPRRGGRRHRCSASSRLLHTSPKATTGTQHHRTRRGPWHRPNGPRRRPRSCCLRRLSPRTHGPRRSLRVFKAAGSRSASSPPVGEQTLAFVNPHPRQRNCRLLRSLPGRAHAPPRGRRARFWDTHPSPGRRPPRPPPRRQPEALRLALGGFPPARLNRLPLVGRRLLHLELPSPLPGGLAWAAALPRLRCLSLAGASQVAAESLYLLSALPQVRACGEPRAKRCASESPVIAAWPRRPPARPPGSGQSGGRAQVGWLTPLPSPSLPFFCSCGPCASMASILGTPWALRSPPSPRWAGVLGSSPYVCVQQCPCFRATPASVDPPLLSPRRAPSARSCRRWTCHPLAAATPPWNASPTASA